MTDRSRQDPDAGGLLVDARSVSLTYLPTPTWLRWLIRSAIDEPVHALRDVSFQLRAGEICGVIGPNGAGKSTLFRLLMGLLLPSEGSVAVVGRDTREDQLALHTHVGFMPADDRTLFLRYSCEENLQFHARLHGYHPAAAEDRVRTVLDRVGLLEARTRTAIALSSGMRSRLLLARALLHQPSLLILDEPTGPLDPVTAHDFIDMLRHVATEDGVGVVVSSHRMEDIESLQDRVVLLDDGRIVYDGGVERLRSLHAATTTTITCRSEAGARSVRDAIAAEDATVVVGSDGAELRLVSDRPIGPLLGQLGDALQDVVSVDRTRPSLQDVMAGVVRGRRSRS